MDPRSRAERDRAAFPTLGAVPGLPKSARFQSAPQKFRSFEGGEDVGKAIVDRSSPGERVNGSVLDP